MTDWTATTLLAERDWLRALATRLVRDEAERDDLVQEACLAALRNPAAEALDPRRWLGAVLRNRWRFARRTDARRRERELVRGEARTEPSAAELAEQAELQRVLVGAVLALDEPYRSTVLLRFFGDLSSRAIAKREGVPEGTVRSRLKRALDQLREELDRKSGERRAWVLVLVPLVRREAVLSTGVVAAAAGIAVLLFAGLGLRNARSDSTAEVVPVMAAADLVAEDAAPLREGAIVARESAPVAPTVMSAVPETGLQLLVLDAGNVPVPGASVTASGDFLFTLVTDVDGSCRLPLNGWRSDHLPLRVEAPGFVHADETLTRGGFSWSSPYPVYLVPAVDLEGHVLDAQSRSPIVGAELLLLHYCDVPLLDRATTGSDGAFRLGGAPQGWEVQVELRAHGYATQRRRLQVPSGAGTPLEILVERGEELNGRVIDAVTRRPIAGARALRVENWWSDTEDEGSALLAQSEADGAIALRLTEEDAPGDVLVTAPGFGAVRARPRADDFELPLIPAAVIEGTVRDVGGRPCAGTVVGIDAHKRETTGSRLTEIIGPGPAWLGEARYFCVPWRATADEQGRFRIEGALPGVANVKLYGLRGACGRGETVLATALQPGETARVELRVAALQAEEVAGVLRIEGQPAPGRVVCRWPGGSADAWSASDGSFEIRGVPPGVVELDAWPDELERDMKRPRRKLTTVTVEPGVVAHVQLDLALDFGTIAGRVTAATGEPRPNMGVHASASGAAWRGLTDSAGRFAIRVPRSTGIYEVNVQGAQAVRTAVDAEELLITSSRTGRLRVRAIDAATGTVIDRPELFVRPLGGRWDWKGSYSAGPDGLVEFVLDPGRFDFVVNKVDDGYPPVLVSGVLLIEGGEREVDVELSRVAPLRFQLTTPLPKPNFVRIEATGADSTFALREFGDSGPFVTLSFVAGVAEVTAIPSGRYRIVASSNGKDIPLEPSEIEVGADRSQPIEIRWQGEAR